MAINLQIPNHENIFPVNGVRIGVTSAGIKKTDKNDLTIFAFEKDTNVSGVFTKNLFCAAPVQICKKHLFEKNAILALIINTGIANSCTGIKGINDALEICKSLAHLMNINLHSILPFSTGVILENLPTEKIINSIPNAIKNLNSDQWYNAANSIMTTDTLPKIYSNRLKINEKIITFTGISKGAGMIMPNMATMLSFICTDAGIDKLLLNRMTEKIANKSFNRITVDGDTSTNDSFIIAATGKSNIFINSENDKYYNDIYKELENAAIDLATKIIRDAEGATKFITVKVNGAKEEYIAKKIGYSIANSPLVKTAFFASDPNLGRIVSAIGQTCIDNLDINKIKIWIGNYLIFENNQRSKFYDEKIAKEIMNQDEIDITINLNDGIYDEIIYTCDLSNEYIDINANYRS